MDRDRKVRFEDYCDDMAITAERLTSDIRNCYETVDRGRKLLGRLYEKLQEPNIGNKTPEGFQRDYQLFIELDNLRDVLLQIAEKRNHYVKQLTKAENILWLDRREMDAFLNVYRSTEKRLREEVEFFGRFSQRPQALVLELQENSKILGELLSELKEQLMAEEKFIKRQHSKSQKPRLGGSFSASPRDRWSYIHEKRENRSTEKRESERKARNEEYECAMREDGTTWRPNHQSVHASRNYRGEIPCRDSVANGSSFSHALEEPLAASNEPLLVELPEKREEKKDEYDTSSLSNRLKQLVKQSENVQKLIYQTHSTETQDEEATKGEESKSNVYSSLTAIEKGAYNEPRKRCEERSKQSTPGSRSSLNDERNIDNVLDSSTMRPPWKRVMQRCDEIEKRVQACSPTAIREKLLYNLGQLEKESEEMERAELLTYFPKHRTIGNDNPVDHYRIRKEFLQCLDTIFAMEKSYGSAGDEIQRLKKELGEALRDRDETEEKLRNEIARLQVKVDVKCKDVEFYNQRLSETKKSLFELKAKHELELREAEAINENLQNEELKVLKEECEKLKEKVDEKSKEVDALRGELQNAVERMQNIRAGAIAEPLRNEAQKYRSQIISLEEEVSRLTSTNKKTANTESIAEELAALQKLVEIAEGKQETISGEFLALRKDYDILLENNSKIVKENEKMQALLEGYNKQNIKSLQEKIEEQQLILIAKNAEIEFLTKNPVKESEDPFKEQYEIKLKSQEAECDRLRKKLKDYEDLITEEGRNMNRRLEEMYNECLESVSNVRKEKEELEEDFQRQRRLYEDLLAECHNEMNKLKKKGNEADETDNIQGKKEALETLLSRSRDPAWLTDILNRGLVETSSKIENEKLMKDNENLQQKIATLDQDIFAYEREIDTLKKKNKELREKVDFMKSENYLMNKIREDDGKEKLRSYKALLEKKEEECNRLRRTLDDSICYEEREELLGRLRDIHRELLQNDDVKGDLPLERLQESLENRDREIRRLKRQNRILSETLYLDDPSKNLALEKLTTLNRSSESLNGNLDVENSNEELKKQIKELVEKLSEAKKAEEHTKSLIKKAKDAERQCESLEDENVNLRERLKSFQQEVKELSILARNRKLGKGNEEFLKENETLKEAAMLKEAEVKRLGNEVEELKSRLVENETEASRLKEFVESNAECSQIIDDLKAKLAAKEAKMKELNRSLATAEKGKQEIHEDFVRLKIKSEEEAKLFGHEIINLQNEVEGLVAGRGSTPTDVLNASRESIEKDEKDGVSNRYDRNKLIRKLQGENHQMAVRILSLEDETTAITKIVADMERGHGHLTGILRGHLILQKDSTAKLLENSLQQYSDEFESCRKKFKAVEDKYDKDRQHLTRRSFAWDLFTNATATIDNIGAILDEGLIKVDDDLERDFSSDEDFEARDYKSRLWILRKRLDDVEKRYRDLMLRAEELSVRLDAKTAEYDVTQDELQDATRVLELNEITMARIRDELDRSLKENVRLKSIMNQLKENQEKTIGAVLTENEMLKKEIEEVNNDRATARILQLELENMHDKVKIDDEEVRGLRRRLHEQEREEREKLEMLKEEMRENAKQYEDEIGKLNGRLETTKKKHDESHRRISELEDLLRKAEEQNDLLERYLQKSRSECKSDGIDHHGTIHMLRDDLKKLFKENEELKKEIGEKQKKITALAKDLRQAKVAVKEQLGTERTLDEKVVDRAAKDQIMALKRRIRVLELEKERLLKSASIRARDQSWDEKNKKYRPKSAPGERQGKVSSSLSMNDARSTSKGKSTRDNDTSKSFSEGILDDFEGNSISDIDVSLTSVESFKEFSDDFKKEIELRDNLIQELEARVRELKHELTMRSGQMKKPGVDEQDSGVTSLQMDDKSIALQDIESLKKENAKLKQQLQSQKDAPSSYYMTKKDDSIKSQRTKLIELEKEITEKDKQLKFLEKEVVELKKRLGKDWKSKEIVLIESSIADEAASLQDVENLKEEMDALKKTCAEQNMIIEELTSELQKEKSSSVNGKGLENNKTLQTEDNIEAVVENVAETAFEFPAELEHENDSSQRAPRFINIPKSKGTQNQAAGTSGTKAKPLSKIPISPRPKQAKASQNGRKKGGNENVNGKSKEALERKVNEQEEDIKTLLESIELFEKEVDDLKKRLKDKEAVDEKLKKSEIELKNLKMKKSKMEEQIKASKDHDEKLKDLEERIKKLSTENRNLEQQMKKSKKKQSDEGEKIKSKLDVSEQKIANQQQRIDHLTEMLDKRTEQFEIAKEELDITGGGKLDDEKKLRKAFRESLKEKLAVAENKGFNEADEKAGIKRNELEEENDRLVHQLTETNSDFENSLAEVNSLRTKLQEAVQQRDSAYLLVDESKEYTSRLENEIEDLRSRNIALEITQDAVSLTGTKTRESNAIIDEEIDDLVFQLRQSWSNLREIMKDRGVCKEEDLILTSAEVGNSINLIRDTVHEIAEVKRLVGNYAQTSVDDLDEQRKLNSHLENKVEEFRKIIEETNLKISDLEAEASEKEKGDEIGHQLLLDQVSDLKKNISKTETDKNELEAEVERRQQHVDRLTEQIKFLESQVSRKDLENSELTQRALDSEEDLEQMKQRVEELEDDYNRLLQFGMRLDENAEDEEKERKLQEEKQLIEKLNEKVKKLEEEKIDLEEEKNALEEERIELKEEKNALRQERNALKQEKKALEERTEVLIRDGDVSSSKTEIEKEEYSRLEETVYRLELDKADLQKKVDEYLTATADNEGLEDQLKQSEKKILSLEDAMFRLEIEKASLQKRLEESERDREDKNSKSDRKNLKLDLQREGLQKRIEEMTPDGSKGDMNELTMLLIESEEKVADLEGDKRSLIARQEELQRIIDEMLASPRSDSDDNAEITDEEREIFKGGPRSWKRRLVAAYRDLREKSIEVSTLKMILESKNVELDVLSKDHSEDVSSISEGDGSLGRTGGVENQQQLKEIIRMLQEEVKMKSSEVIDLREEVSSLQNKIQMQEEGHSENVSLRINGKDGNEIENEELREQLNNLTKALTEKEDQYDALCDQLFGGDPLVTSSENEQLRSEVKAMKDKLMNKEKSYEELENNYELVYNELTKMKAGIDVDDSTVKQLEGKEEKVQQLEQALSEYEEKFRLVSDDYDELEDKYREEMNYASTHIGQLMIQIGELEEQLRVMRQQKQDVQGRGNADEMEIKILENKLKNSEDDLRRKQELVANLKETLSNLYENAGDQSESLSKELKRLAKENNDLQDQLDLQKQRYELELDSMRTSMNSLKGEHVTSLKEDFERVCQDKIDLQVKLSEMSEQLSKDQEKIDELVKVNNDLQEKLKSKKEDDVLDLLDFTA